VALLSLNDKTGATEFARALLTHGATLVASGGTAAHLEAAGLRVTPVEKWTGSGEMLGGRVKTLHPNIHGAILARRGSSADAEELSQRGIVGIDCVAVNLYPFEQRASAGTDAEAVELVDIGGVALLRAAAKNHEDVVVLHDPAQYAEALAAFTEGGPTLAQRRGWAAAAFARTATYDAAIAAEMTRRTQGVEPGSPPPVIVTALERVRTLRYGENPDQPAALYARAGSRGKLEAWREGKELSYNNLLDLAAAVMLAGRFDKPACVIVKHAEPCGVALADTPLEAFERAFAADSLSAFGGIVALNRPLDAATAAAMAGPFLECVAATEIRPEAAEALKSKVNLRLLRLAAADVAPPSPWRVRDIGAWSLVQRDVEDLAPKWLVVTQRVPSREELESMQFAFEVVAAARSNAVVLVRGSQLIGLGSGQTSRVDAVDVALMKARRAGHATTGAVLASDGFFPFADNIEHAAEAGITTVVQPGGSKRDEEVITACDAHGIAMAFTDRRVFRH